jgi:putative tricarboxylic transport membrane protein
MAWGAVDLRRRLRGVGPNFLPWVVATVLALCGVGVDLGSAHGRLSPDGRAASGAARGDWVALAWVAAGVAANAALITRRLHPELHLCFMLAVRGLRGSEGKPHGGVRGR